MKKRNIILLCLFTCLLFNACGSPKESENKKAANENNKAQKLEINTKNDSGEPEDESKVKETDDSNVNDTSENKNDAENKVTEQQTKTISISVFYSTPDATAFTADMVTIDKLTPENVIKALADKGVVPTTVKVNSLENKEIEGMQSLDLDLSQEFKDYLSGQGSTGEYYTIGSVCNTYIKAYHADRIKITVNGNTLETGHNDYPDYMYEY